MRNPPLMEAILMLRGANQLLNESIVIRDCKNVSSRLLNLQRLQSTLETYVQKVDKNSLIQAQLIPIANLEIKNSKTITHNASSLLRSSLYILK